MNLRSMIWALAALAGSVGLATAQHAAVQLEAARSPIVSEDGPVVEAVTQPGTYQRDNGSLTSAWGAGNNEIIGIQPFTAAGGSDVITSISTKWWSDMSIGQPAKIAVWQDVGTGIGGAQLLHVQNVTVLAVGDTFNTYQLSTPVSVSGTFYIGFSIITGAGLFGLGYQDAASVPAGVSYFLQGTPAANFTNLNANFVADVGLSSPGYFTLRATSASTGFTYQGKLDNGGTPATGSYDMRFQLTNGLGGAAIASEYNVLSVPVTQGVFTVRIPIDPTTIYNSTIDPYLQISVRPAGIGSYVTLSPAQRISQVPTAMAAHIAEQARSLANFSRAGAPFLVDAGDWGLGSNAYAPGSGIILNSSASSYLNLLAPNNAETGVLFGKPAGGAANAGIVHNNTGTLDGLQFRTGGNNTRMILNAAGRMGVGNTDPQELVDVSGRLQVRGATAGETAGVWLASPVASPTKRAFVGMFDNDNVGLFGPTAGWGLTMNTSTGYVGIGRQSPVGSSRFDVANPLATNGSFAGMYVVSGAGGLPFYGYSVNGGITAFTYVNPTSNTWRLNYGGENFVVSNTGLVGIGTGSPSASGYRLELPNTAGPAGQGRANAWVTYSSRELKENVATLTDPVGMIRKLRGVSFDWKSAMADGTHKHDIGFIAEEVGAVLPELVTRTGDGKATGLDYGRVVPVTVEAIKQQQTRLEALEAENAELKARLERLEKALQR
ncbi:hypothetical protein LBMAG48_05430 [Phycisphaerae bacterium]|nr:hypothetical protein LBMAG48_05430 [Phycisphaerae bacterium]